MTTTKTDIDEVNWGPCCFCGNDIQKNDIDPCRLTVETSSGEWQVWFCHAACFKGNLTTKIELDLSPAHF